MLPQLPDATNALSWVLSSGQQHIASHSGQEQHISQEAGCMCNMSSRVTESNDSSLQRHASMVGEIQRT